MSVSDSLIYGLSHFSPSHRVFKTVRVFLRRTGAREVLELAWDAFLALSPPFTPPREDATLEFRRS